MGLIKEMKHYKKLKEFEELFKEVFDMSVSEAKEKLMKTKEGNTPVVVSEEQQKKYAEEAMSKMTPEQLVQVFSGDVERFYPDGNKPKSNA